MYTSPNASKAHRMLSRTTATQVRLYRQRAHHEADDHDHADREEQNNPTVMIRSGRKKAIKHNSW
jgi:hypothetical protein